MGVVGREVKWERVVGRVGVGREGKWGGGREGKWARVVWREGVGREGKWGGGGREGDREGG